MALAHAKLDEILNRREFRFVHGPSEAETYWALLKNWVWQWFSKLLSRTGAHPHLTDILLWGTVVVLSLVFMGWLISALMQDVFPVRFAPPGRRPGGPLAAGGARGSGGRRARRLSRGYPAHLRRGGHSPRAGRRVAGGPGANPPRICAPLPSGSTRLPHLLAITDRFEKVWYGGAPASARDYETARAELERLA